VLSIENQNAKSDMLNGMSRIRMDSYATLNVQFKHGDVY
jgi:hypothetical protein